MQYRSAGLDRLVTNPADRLGSGPGKVRVHFSVGFGVNVVKRESEAQVEWKTPLRWEWARRLWWRCGGREWNQNINPGLVVIYRAQQASRVFGHFRWAPVVSRLSSRPPCLSVAVFLLSSPSCSLFLCFFLSLSGAENWLQAQGTELFQGRIKVRTMMARKLGVVGVAAESGG